MYSQSELDYNIVNKIKEDSDNNSQAYKILDHMTSVFGPRLSGTRNYMDAAIWAKEKLESWGIENVHFDSYSDDFRTWSMISYSI